MGKLGYKGLLLLGVWWCWGSGTSSVFTFFLFYGGDSARLQLNPGLQPTKDILICRLLVHLICQLLLMCWEQVTLLTFLNSGSDLYSNDKLFDRLKTDNRLNVNLNTDILSLAGIRKRIWSLNVGLRADFGAALSKDMFSMMHTNEWFSLENAGTNQNYSLSNQTLEMHTLKLVWGILVDYRKIDSRWTQRCC